MGNNARLQICTKLLEFPKTKYYNLFIFDIYEIYMSFYPHIK